MEHVNSINAVKFSNCIRFSNDANILNLFSTLTPESRKHILLSYFAKFKHTINKYQNKSRDRNVFSRFAKVLEHQTMLQNAKKTDDDSSLTICNLSSELFANIISFLNMFDRLLISERLSTKLYDISQMKEAKSELVITKSFVKNALNDKIDISKFSNIKRLCIRFVFCNPIYNYHKRNLELKYYQIIHKIISNSLSDLNSIEYNLSENSFRSFLGNSNKWNKQYHGSFLDFIRNLCIATHCNDDIFANIDRLIWIEKERKDIRWITGGGKSMHRQHQWLMHEDDVHEFIRYFKHIRCLSLSDHFNLSSYPLVSQIWSNKHYYHRLQHLHINLKDIIIDNDDDDDDIVTEIGHPLVILSKFTQLVSLHLVLPIFKDCADYYDALLSPNIDYNESVIDVNIEFFIDAYVNKHKSLDVMDQIWDYMICQCPYIVHFKCRVINDSNLKLNTNHSYISKLNGNCIGSVYYESQSLDIKRNMIPILRRMNVRHLKELTLSINQIKENQTIEQCLESLNLDRFISLQSFTFIYGKLCTFNKGEFVGSVVKNVIGFLEYIDSYSVLSTTLNHIQLSHYGYRDKHCVKHLSVNIAESEKIIKLLISITTKHENIDIISLLPTGIREKELQYLEFWYNCVDKKCGQLFITQWRNIKKSYFVDLEVHTNVDS